MINPHVRAFLSDQKSIIDKSNQLQSAPVKRVVVILSASRSASSLLHYILRNVGPFLSLAGEHSHLYKVHGLLHSGQSDFNDGVYTSTAEKISDFTSSLLFDMTPSFSREMDVSGAHLARMARRLWFQWHEKLPSFSDVYHILHDLIRSNSAKCQQMSESDFTMLVVRTFLEGGFQLNPWYYDVPEVVVRTWFPGFPEPAGPPALDFVLEEPPFLEISSHPAPVTSAVEGSPLLLKSPLDSYRIPLLRVLFPEAHLVFIHLTRNPAGSVNGLIDGWLHRGFFSHRFLDGPQLNIDGYSDLPWGRQWWNFDLPPGWVDYIDRPLEEVCAYQWAAANRHILSRTRDCPGSSYLRVKAEDILAGGDARDIALRQILQIAQVAPMASLDVPDRRIMSTAPPRPGRWQERARRILPSLTAEPVRSVSSEMGYHDPRTWI
jgi:hypothetical protein